MIIYLGNMLADHTGSVSVIETLAPKLTERYEVKCASPKKSQLLRLYDMLGAIVTNRRRASVVLIDSYSTKAYYYTIATSLLCRLYKISYVPILHGGNFPERLKRSKFWTRQVFGNSFANIAPSGYLKYHFNKAGFNVIYIPNHVNIENYTFRQRLSASPKILWVRAFHRMYNPFLAIDVLSLLKDSYPQIEICMVGPDKDGSMEQFREYGLNKGVNPNINITGSLTKKEWTGLSAGFDIFLNTTDVDNTPLSVIEAMSLGMLIISTNAGGLPYLLEDGQNALLVPVRDPEAMASAIRRLLDDPVLCQKLSFNARKKAEGFAWETVREKWMDLLDKVSMSKR